MLPSARRLLVLLALAASPLALAPSASAVEPGVVIGLNNNVDLEHAQVERVGAGWARLFVEWSQLEPEKDGFQAHLIEDFDRRIDAYNAKGVKVLVTIFDAPAWAAKDPSAPAATVQPPADPATYATFVGLMAKHWKGRVSAYEIWNEPDLAKWWAPAPSAGDYAALLRATAPRIRAEDPAAKVISGGLAGGNVTFLEALYDAGMTGADIDGIGVHMSTACRVDMPGVYYREPDGRVGQFAFTGYRELYQESVERGAAEEIWMTELGISTLTDTCAEGSGAGNRPAGVPVDKQAQFVREAYACLAADTYVGPAMWFSLQDVGASASGYDHWMGLFRPDGTTEKPAVAAFAALKGGITPNPACGGKLDTVSPTVTISAPPVFDERLPIKVTATDAETPVGRIYLTIRKASDPPEAQTQIPGGGQGGTYELNWLGARELPLDVPHVITGYAADEAKNLGGASVTVVRSKTAIKVATSSEIDVSAKKGRRAVAKGSLTYTVPTGSAIKGRGRLYFEFFEKKNGKKKARWVTGSRFTILASALRRARILDKATGKRRATFTKAAKLRGTAKKWRVRFEFEGVDPYQDSRAMAQFKAKG